MDFGQVLTDATRSAIGLPAAAFAIAAIGLNVQFGYAGLLNFGHVGFLMVGAYGTAITVDRGGSLWLGIVVGVAAAVVLGLLLGLPSLRLRADYLAIVTISAAEIIRLLVRSGPLDSLTHSVFGIAGFADAFYDLNPIPNGRYGLGDVEFSERNLWVILVAWSLVALGTLVVWALVRSPWGRVLRAIREDEDAARSLGKNAFSYKLQSFVIGGAFGAVAGIIFSIDRQAVRPEFFFPLITFYAFTIVILGGPGRVFSPIVGSMIFWFIISGTDSLLREAIHADYIRFIDTTDIGAVRFALVGLMLMLLVLFRPQGIFGRREELFIGD